MDGKRAGILSQWRRRADAIARRFPATRSPMEPAGPMTRLRDRLYDAPPFTGLELSDVEPDLTGWGSTHGVFRAAIERLRPSLIVEVGTWKGGSAIHMAGLCREFGIDAEIVCVDTWLGAPIAWTTEPALKPSLQLKGGYPQLYYTFARNVIDAGVEDLVTPLPSPSEGGHTILKHFGAKADLVYIDADHDYAPAKRDMERYLELLGPDGVMIGDDFGCFPGVTQAAKEIAEEHDLFALKQREKIVLSRTEIAERLGLKSDGWYERVAA
jgi:predicted O-methyltransferase YrrM